jgi:hypothetical protein
MTRKPRHIGIDFDNTLVCYDALLLRLARKAEWLPEDFTGGKTAIRDAVRRLPDGGWLWQHLQALAYGPHIEEAEPFPGALEFLECCRASGIRVSIISHKTIFPNVPELRVNLREAALVWMQRYGVFSQDHTGLITEPPFFAASRQEKVEHIAERGCDLFVDDLVETFREPLFPQGVKKVLFDPESRELREPDVHRCASWEAISQFVFGAMIHD